MKTCACIALLILTHVSLAQERTATNRAIDEYAMSVDAPSPEELAQRLTAPYATNLEKVRAIFSWVAQHINYSYKPAGMYSSKDQVVQTDNRHEEVDTSSSLKPMIELVAKDVLRKRTAFCYGYSRLFKCLCDHAGIACEVINGYARGDFNKVGRNFRTNHTWNAVWVDSCWRLVDVTWATGYFSHISNEFIKHFEDQYFLTDPQQFALDHFPDDLNWSLLQQPPAPREFQHSPYKSRCFTKYSISAYWPETGIIKAAVGDTINLSVQTNLAYDRNIAGGSLEDTSLSSPLRTAVYCQPAVIGSNNTLTYKYIVHSADTQWLQLVYNDDMILRYKLDIREEYRSQNSEFRIQKDK